MLVWILDEELGDGIIDARLSGRDIQNGETAMGQVHPALEGAHARGLVPRMIIVTNDNSGGLAYEDRCDFELIEQEIYAGRCRWVWFRDVKRLIRNVTPFYRFRDLLISTGTDLWLTDMLREALLTGTRTTFNLEWRHCWPRRTVRGSTRKPTHRS